MKKLVLTMTFIATLLFAINAMATTTPTIGQLNTAGSRGEREVYLPITLTADGTGGAVSDFAISAATYGTKGLQLVEVEIVHGTSTAAVTIENQRDTETWAISAMDATQNRLYSGHLRWGIFPKMDCDWKLSTGAVDANDVVVIWLKFSSKP